MQSARPKQGPALMAMEVHPASNRKTVVVDYGLLGTEEEGVFVNVVGGMEAAAKSSDSAVRTALPPSQTLGGQLSESGMHYLPHYHTTRRRVRMRRKAISELG